MAEQENKSGLWTRLRGSAGARYVSNLFADAAEQLGTEVRSVGANTLEHIAKQFNDALPYIAEAGYKVLEIEVGIGISPRLIAHLRRHRELSLDEEKALLELVKQRRFLSLLMQTLFNAGRIQRRMQFTNFEFQDLELELSVLPTASVKFRPRGAVAVGGEGSRHGGSGPRPGTPLLASGTLDLAALGPNAHGEAGTGQAQEAGERGSASSMEADPAGTASAGQRTGFDLGQSVGADFREDLPPKTLTAKVSHGVAGAVSGVFTRLKGKQREI